MTDGPGSGFPSVTPQAQAQAQVEGQRPGNLSGEAGRPQAQWPGDLRKPPAHLSIRGPLRALVEGSRVEGAQKSGATRQLEL